MDRDVNFRPDQNLGGGNAEFTPSDRLGVSQPGLGGNVSDRFEPTGGQSRTDQLKERASETVDQLKSRASDTADQLRGRASEKADALVSRADAGRARAADQLDRVSDRIDERAREMEMKGGMQARAGSVAHRTSEQLDRSADYVRTHDIDEMREDLESQIRSHPIASVGIALGCGFVIGRMIS